MKKEMQLYLTTMQQGYFDDTQEIKFSLNDKGEVFIGVEHNELKIHVDDLRKIVKASDLIRGSE